MGTGLRVAIPVLNIHKTRLNDPFMWFMGTNDQPGDLAEDTHGKKEPVKEKGHPLRHVFTRSIPTAQCMNCHGWNFRAIFKRDRDGNLLDAAGAIVANDDPEKFRKEGEGKFVEVGTNPGKAVHMMDIHAEKGLQCADCHFAQDSHGTADEYRSRLQ